MDILRIANFYPQIYDDLLISPFSQWCDFYSWITTLRADTFKYRQKLVIWIGSVGSILMRTAYFHTIISVSCKGVKYC